MHFFNAQLQKGVSGSTDIEGSGTSNVEDILALWAEYYQYSKDSVSLTYASSNVSASLDSYSQGDLDFVCVDGVLPESYTNATDFVQLPFIGTALVAAYHLDGLPESLILDGNTLARIWLGEIAFWDDPAIIVLNNSTGNANFTWPHINITLAYRAQGALGSQRDVWNKAMSAFNSDFEDAITTANGDLAQLPLLKDRSFISTTLADRVNYVKVSSISATCLLVLGSKLQFPK